MKKQQNTIKWLNVFLLIINLSAFATFLFLTQMESDVEYKQVNSDEFLRDQLMLSDEQYEKVRELDRKVFRNYQLLIDVQCETNFELIKELSNESPSEEELKRLTDKIGKYHALVKRQTVQHFENVKSVCNLEQVDLLNNLLLEMMEAGDKCQQCNKADCPRRNQINRKN